MTSTKVQNIPRPVAAARRRDWLELSPHFAATADGQSWYDLDVLREGVEVFIALSHEHMALEESLIYQEARAHSRLAERGEMGREMAARRRAEHRATPTLVDTRRCPAQPHRAC